MTPQHCLAKSGFAHKLLDLSLSGCPRLDEQGFVSLCRRLPKLRNLSLSGCTDCVTDPMVEAIGHHCHEMRLLDVS